MTDTHDRPKSLAELLEKLWQDVLDAIDSLAPAPEPVPVPIRKSPRR